MKSKQSRQSMVLIQILFIILELFAATIQSSDQLSPKQFIVDTDIGPWPDDVGALAMLHTAADQGKVHILAIMGNNAYEGIVAVIDAMNTYFNRSSIPIGITRDANATKFESQLDWYPYLLKNYPHPNYNNNSDAEDSVKLYRRLLSSATDHSINILSIGYLTNLANLLESSGDEYTSLNGKELVQKKVQQMYVMAGEFPVAIEPETNIADATSAAQRSLPIWPSPVTYIGAEIGKKIICGLSFFNSTQKHGPIAKAFQLALEKFGKTEGCFDEAAALAAIFGKDPFFTAISGNIEIHSDGTNYWNISGSQQYLKLKGTEISIVKKIETLMNR